MVATAPERRARLTTRGKRRIGPLGRSEQLHEIRELNFGRRAFHNEICYDQVLAEISRCDAADTAEVTRSVRSLNSLTLRVDELLQLYRDVIDEYKAMHPSDPFAELPAAAAYIEQMNSVIEDGFRRQRNKERMTRVKRILSSPLHVVTFGKHKAA
jgi:hypothetical protein